MELVTILTSETHIFFFKKSGNYNDILRKVIHVIFINLFFQNSLVQNVGCRIFGKNGVLVSESKLLILEHCSLVINGFASFVDWKF